MAVSSGEGRRSQTSVSLEVIGESPEVAELARLSVGKFWRQGDQLVKTHFRHTGWGCKSRLTNVAGLTEQVDDVLAQTKSVWAELRRASATGVVRLAVGLWIGDEQPDIRLTAGHMSLLAELGASAVFDIYPWLPDKT